MVWADGRGNSPSDPIADALPVRSAAAARDRAKRLFETGNYAGVDAFTITGDEELGEYGEATFHVRLGQVPDWEGVGMFDRVVGQLLLRGILILAAVAFVSGCASAVPRQQHDICAVFDQRPGWYDDARASANTWGTPVHILMAFVRHESSYRSDARPPVEWLWFIPLGRPSSAKGYAQAQDPVWGEYQAERGRLFRSRSDMADALDFIGWYNHKTWRALGIVRTDARRLYLAYHEGRTGYRHGTWKRKPGVVRTAERVARTARAYRSQLARCETRFRCRRWYQVWPFCR